MSSTVKRPKVALSCRQHIRARIRTAWIVPTSSLADPIREFPSTSRRFSFITAPTSKYQKGFVKVTLYYKRLKRPNIPINSSCPYDSLRVFDYQRSSRDLVAHKSHSSGQKLGKKQLKSSSLSRYLIDTYCGRKVNFTLFSTNNQFEIEFEMSNSLGNEEYAEDENRILLRKGFRARYTFSKYFADLAFITGTHIVGTSNGSFCCFFMILSRVLIGLFVYIDCDQRITSQTPTGFIYSPNFLKTFTINASCKYIFEGVNDNYNSESIKLNFYLIDFKPTASNNLYIYTYIVILIKEKTFNFE